MTNRRTIFEFALLAAGLVLGVGAVLLLRPGPAAPEPAPVEVRGGRPAAVTAEWRVYRGDAGLTGRTDETVPDAVAIAWRHRTGGPILSSPVVAGGRVYVGSNDNRVHCLDAASGEPIWTFPTGDDVEAPPLVVEDRVFVGSVDGTLYAIDAVSGEGVWTYVTGDAIRGGASFFRAPDGSGRVLVGSYDRSLHCVDAVTGAKLFTVETGNYVNGAPAVAGDAVVFGGCDGLIHVVDAQTGESRREVALGDGVYVASSVAVDRGVAYVAHVGNACVAVALDSGEFLWTFQSGDGYFSSPYTISSATLKQWRHSWVAPLERENFDSAQCVHV